MHHLECGRRKVIGGPRRRGASVKVGKTTAHRGIAYPAPVERGRARPGDVANATDDSARQNR